jgi:flagellar hook-associated protein 1
MGLSGLDAALSGLRVAQQKISLISNNIANVSTPGYTRKILPQSSQVVNGTTVGVSGETIIRQVSLSLSRDLWTQISGVNELDVQAAYLKRVEQFHGPPDKQLSIAAELARLQDSFSELSDDPSDTLRQANVVNQAIDTAQKINNLAQLLTTLRNDAQDEMVTTVNRINALLGKVAELNYQVDINSTNGRSTAAIEDQRDEAVKELAGLIEIDFFKRSDGVMVLQTTQGVELAADTAKTLYFNAIPVAANTYYPASAAAIYVGNPAQPGAVDITTQSPGGKLGGLIELRDQTFPKQMAQLDELAHKIALRFAGQGLMLFTDGSGNIPADTAPDPTTLPNPTPVAYVGFAGQIQVNEAIVNDNSYLQRGTYGAIIPSGSNEVIRRIVQFTFGDYDFQRAIGDIDLRVSANAPPNNTLQRFLGIRSQNTVDGTRDLAAFADPASFIAAANGDLDPPNDTFRLTFEDANLGLGPVNIDVSLATIVDGPGNFAQDLVTRINAIRAGLPAGQQADLTAMGVTFSVGTNGQLRIQSTGTVSTDATTVPNGMGENDFALLGFNEDTYPPTDPYFDIQVGNTEMTRITIDSNDTEVDLLAKLQTVPGLAVEDLTASIDGFLRIRPGNDYTNPEFGGDLRIISGLYTTSGAGANAVFGPGTIPDGINIVSALFGSFSTAPTQDLSPISNVQYQSETNASLAPPIPTQSFRSDLLGPGANISIDIIGTQRIVNFAQKMVNEQSQQVIIKESQKADEKALQDILQEQLLNESAVNIDEELSQLIVVQTAYAAAARVVNAVNSLFEELLNAVR